MSILVDVLAAIGVIYFGHGAVMIPVTANRLKPFRKPGTGFQFVSPFPFEEDFYEGPGKQIARDSLKYFVKFYVGIFAIPLLLAIAHWGT